MMIELMGGGRIDGEVCALGRGQWNRGGAMREAGEGSNGGRGKVSQRDGTRQRGRGNEGEGEGEGGRG